MVTFEEISEQARKSPVTSSLPPLASFYLSDFSIYRSIDAFHSDLYDPDYQFAYDVIIDTDARHRDYPQLRCTADPVNTSLNQVIDWGNREHHDRIKQDLLNQSSLKSYITDTVTGEDLVALIIIDGLSYETVRRVNKDVLQPVVVDGITTTEPGFRRIIYGGDPASVYASLTGKGFYTGYGFTYWERGQETLSTDLHSAIGQNTHRIRDFDEAITTLESKHPFSNKTYVQITRMGLDQDSHNRKEEPERNSIRDAILDDVRQLAEFASKTTDSFRIFLTSDHGILWRDQLPKDPPAIHDDSAHHARFLDEAHAIDQGLTMTDESGEKTTGLAYPYLARELKHTEWGVHGGFSYQESIVPLIEITSPGDLS